MIEPMWGITNIEPNARSTWQAVSLNVVQMNVGVRNMREAKCQEGRQEPGATDTDLY